MIHPDVIRELAGDPPQQLSLGTVEEDDPVAFDAVADYGPVVTVALQPSRVSVQARVLQPVAGNGEGAYHPFVAGDEVLVALLGGARGDCVVLGKLSNGVDRWPEAVAGQDPTTNSFAFVRTKTPLLVECSGTFMLREALTEALVAVDANGAVTVRDGAGDALQLSADAFGVQDASGKFVVQLDFTGGRATVQAGDALLSLSSSDAKPSSSALVAPGQLSIAAAGNPAHEHLVTTEALAGVLTQLLTAIGLASPGPLIGAALGGAAPAVVSAAVAAAALVPLNPAVAAAVFGAFSAAAQKPPGVPGQGQLQPGIGCPGLLAG